MIGRDFSGGEVAGRRALIVGREFDRVVWLAGAEFKDLSQDPGRHRRYRINAKHRLPERADDLVSHADQPLIAAAAEEQPDNRNLAEHVVQPVHRNEGAAHAHLVSGIDIAFDGPPDHRAFQYAFPDRELPVLAGEFRARAREGNAALTGGRRAPSQAIKRSPALYGEILDVDYAP